ncbi:MAG: ABC transporter ATP-binding protein [Alphaproteobacteria bacterium]|nr:ABC transporter ATP-binding protein [Alphaproteobacteria bacterium]MBU1280840.1 ABC transporter ATP-binding protein [Alphaproteobacteria bacterium]MBU1575264.1 ABC transporter ATP-binding protein [Alphaproteobacteria bacterium]MBU1829145.1 ABC transporter ATP-binding protein [Alphaproteobacteria bacterium]MBU2076678.1 ABC transporter ATP-binding protein [Alphaproteobacteria bacterium]
MTEHDILRIKSLEISLMTGHNILNGIDLTIRAGRIHGVIGESGAGKSMIGSAIADTLPQGLEISRGAIEFDGLTLTDMNARTRRDLLGRDIGFIPQEPMSALNPSLTIGHQVCHHLARIGLRTAKTRQERAVELFTEVGLDRPWDLLQSYPHQLSGGMLQRVLIAMAFASNPRLVIADEPTTALDVTIQKKVVELIARTRAAHNTAVLFITHDLQLAADVCDDVSVLYAGRIVETGAAERIIHAPMHPYSRCLNLATPNLSGPKAQLMILPGTMPGPVDRMQMSGCEFALRCPLAEDQCHSTRPALDGVGTEHKSACHWPERTGSITAVEAPTGTAAGRLGEKLVLRATGLGKAYRQHDWLGRVREVHALRGLDFDVREGEFVGIVGESGSGKSSLTKLIVGLEDVSTGVLELVGLDRATAPRADFFDKVQLVFQDPQSALNPRRKIGRLVTQALEGRGGAYSAATRAELVKTLLAKVMLPPEVADRFPDQLSGGQKQRVNIARALCSNPQLLIADEIVSGLDVSVQAQILELLSALRKEAAFSLLLVSHDLAVVRHVCDRTLVMCKGEIVEQGPVEEVFGNPQHPYTRDLVAAAQGPTVSSI